MLKASETGNRLLSHLAVHERNAIERASEHKFYKVGETLLAANTHSRSVFFPIDVVVSIVRPLRDHVAVEIGVVGNEGMIGLDVVMEAKTQLDDALVQSAGYVYRMPADELLHQFHGGGKLQKYLLRFTHAFLGQVAQNAVCNRYHLLRSRLAKWLLMIHDRSTVDVQSTPQLIGVALGATPEEVEAALAELQTSSGLRVRRQSIVIDRDALETKACECYETLRQEYSRALAS